MLNVPKVELNIVAANRTEKPSEHVASVFCLPGEATIKLHQDEVDALVKDFKLEDDVMIVHLKEGTAAHIALRKLASK